MKNLENNLEKLIENLPFFLQTDFDQYDSKDELIEIILDLGRRPEIRFIHNTEYLSQKIISWQDIDYITKRLTKFTDENRAGLEHTLHRVSCIRNRQFLINGLTCRVGRESKNTIFVIQDLLESKKSILILGKPGVGKTTIIRETAKILANEMGKRVIIIDTSNEIAGSSDIPHSGIGRARRMQVPKTELQHQIMVEAVENHMPQVIIIDEIGTELEVLATRTIAEKGVQLIGTTHGNCLENLIRNPILTDLIGGIQYVTLSDDEARRRKTQKTILERKAYPTFKIIVEINNLNSWTIYENVMDSVDLLLNDNFKIHQTRLFSLSKDIKIKCKSYKESLVKNQNNLIYTSNRIKSFQFVEKNKIVTYQTENEKYLKLKSKNLLIYPYSISIHLLKEVLCKLGFQCTLTNEIKQANLIIGLTKHLRKNFKLVNLAKQKNIPIYALNEINLYQVTKLIQIVN
jgi:stage III sporulation protein SpoIIIAA